MAREHHGGVRLFIVVVRLTETCASYGRQDRQLGPLLGLADSQRSTVSSLGSVQTLMPASQHLDALEPYKTPLTYPSISSGYYLLVRQFMPYSNLY